MSASSPAAAVAPDRAPDQAPTPIAEWTVDQLAHETGVPVRTIREYQTVGLLPPPARRGRVGWYGPGHRARLDLIGRLQERGYSLAGIRDLVAAWRDGADLGEVLGLAPDQLVHIDEPGVAVTADQLATVVPSLAPDRLDELLATGVVEPCGADRYCVPSPSLLQLTVDALAAGLEPSAVLGLLGRIRAAADEAAGAAIETIARLPAGADEATVESLLTRGRSLLAHGVGRLTIHRLGRAIGAPDHATNTQLASLLRRQAEAGPGGSGQ